MSDNTTLNAGSGGDVIATDDIGGIKHQLVKIEYGDADSATQVSASNPLPVSLASVPSHAVTNAGTFATQAAQSGTWNITNVSGTVSLPTGAATAAKQPALGTAGSASADVVTVQGIASMTALKVDGSGVTQPVSGTVTVTPSGTQTVSGTVAVSTVNSVAPAFGSGVRGATVQRVTVATDDVVPVSQSGTWTVQPGNTANTTAWKVDGSAVTQPVSGTVTANMGTVTADPFGANADAASATGSISAKLRFIASTGIPVTGTVTVGSHAVTNAGTFAVQESGTHVQADDAAFTPATSKVTMAGYTADDTSTDSVDEGDGGAARMTLNRKQITQPYESEANNWVYAGATGGLVNTTAVTIKAAAGAGIRAYITSLQLMNSHATTGTEIVINDGSAGTAIWRGFVPPLGGLSATFPVPLKSTANTLLEVKEATATATTGVLVSVQGYLGS